MFVFCSTKNITAKFPSRKKENLTIHLRTTILSIRRRLFRQTIA